MTTVVRNEKATPYVFVAGRNGKTLSPGAVEVLSDDEWSSVPFSQRGPTKLNPIWPTEGTGDANKIKFEHYLVGADYEVRYLGVTQQINLDADALWTIKRFSHTTLGGANCITEIQVLPEVTWADRASLPWT